MITKPKARKFRIRRSAPPEGEQSSAKAAAEPAQKADAVAQPASAAQPGAAAAAAAPSYSQTIRPAADGYAPSPQSLHQGEVSSQHEVAGEMDIDSIRHEGLTGRQLRMARRVAQKNGLAPTSDFDAVLQLRGLGIDPFQRSNMLELVVPGGGGGNNDDDDDGARLPAAPKVKLPQTIPAERNTLPAASLGPAERRNAEIMSIQRDIAARRRRKLGLLLTRLAFFVFLPTFLAGWYFFAIATPMYASKSEFLILQADNQGGGGLGGLLPTQYATSQDSIAVQSFLQSKEAMLRLDQDVGFKSHFSQDWIDPLQRLDPNPTNEAAYKIYKKNVKIGYDPTEGVIRMEVVAADPDVASQFSSRLIAYAEERVDDLSLQKREDAMATALASLEKSKVERREAQEKLVRLQEGTFIDPEGEIGNIRALIGNVEMQLQEKELQLNSLLNNARPNKPRVDAARSDIELLRAELAKQNARMTEAATGGSSLAAKAAQIQMAQADLATADLFLQSALTNEKQTALEASRQVRYLTVPVRPVKPDEASYPRSFENTILAFLIFSGIYLMISLTASILREQVSS
jgi:capsular polysaccharide transport system permease protein